MTSEAQNQVETQTPTSRHPWSDRVFYHIINGVPYADALHTKYHEVFSQKDDAFLGVVPLADDAVIEKAIHAAKAALKDWVTCDRVTVLNRLLEGNVDILREIKDIYAAEGVGSEDYDPSILDLRHFFHLRSMEEERL